MAYEPYRNGGAGIKKRTNSVSVPEEEQLTLTWDKIVVKCYPSRKIWNQVIMGNPALKPRTLLNGVSGISKPGTLTAIMGSSGAGKTTLLNVFNKRKLNHLEVHGNVLLNGLPLEAIADEVRSLFGYVQQHDLLPGELTVREYLTFTANLALSREKSDTAKMHHVDDLLEQLSLMKCADTMIRGKGCISGGERKRLSVACKLFGEARLLFLDEPTTGLDSYMAKILVNNLRSLSRKGYNIICTIHQPSSQVFNSFDNVYFLANGRTAYGGPQNRILDHFSGLGFECPDRYAPADYYIAVLSVDPAREEYSTERINFLCDNFRNSEYEKEITESINDEYIRHTEVESLYLKSENKSSTRKYNASWFTQFRLIFWRNMIYFLRNPSIIRARGLMIAFMSVILLAMYFHTDQVIDQARILDYQGLIFFFCANFTFVNCNRIMVVIPKELPLFLREHIDGLYRTSSYVIATIVSQSLVGAILMFISVGVVYMGSGLRRDWYTIGVCFGIMLLAYYVNVGFVVFQSCIWETPSNTLTAVPQQCFILTLLGGFYITPRSIPFYFMPVVYIDWITSSYEILSINQWADVTNISCSYENELSCISTGEEVLKTYGLSPDDRTFDIYSLLLQLTGFFIIAIIILNLKMKYKWS